MGYHYINKDMQEVYSVYAKINEQQHGIWNTTN